MKQLCVHWKIFGSGLNIFCTFWTFSLCGLAFVSVLSGRLFIFWFIFWHGYYWHCYHVQTIDMRPQTSNRGTSTNAIINRHFNATENWMPNEANLNYRHTFTADGKQLQRTRKHSKMEIQKCNIHIVSRRKLKNSQLSMPAVVSNINCCIKSPFSI